MKLHHNKTLFRQAVQFTSDQLQILPVYVEKDYWVTYALHIIFNHEVGKDTVFKGGTALSKCYNMISRFSEDIDLVVIRREGETDNKLKSKIKTISKTVSEILPEIEIAEVTQKRGMNRKTAHTYNKEFVGTYGQVRDVIVLEASWLGYFEPFTNRTVQSFIGEQMTNNGQTDLAELQGLMPFSVKVLDPTRTLCEKIMSLVRFSYGENPLDDLKKKVRHAYDLHQLLKYQEFSDFFISPFFDTMLIKVANDDIVSFRNNNWWLVNHPKEALIFKNLDTVWTELRTSYNGDFKNMVYGSFPNDVEILQTLRRIVQRLESISWDIKTVT